MGKVAELAKRMPQVVECCRVTGEYFLIMRVQIEGLDRLDRVLDQFLAYGQTTQHHAVGAGASAGVAVAG